MAWATRARHGLLLSALCLVLLLYRPLATAAPAAASAAAPPAVSAAAAVLVEWRTGEVLYAKNAFARRPPASTTKVLTALLALERGRLGDPVAVSPRAARTGGSSMYLRPGQTYTLEELLYGLLLNSGNDAAVAIAEHLAGSVEEFARWMNERARAIGAHQSNFANPHGLHHPSHYSTAYDLALITRHALRHPVFAHMVAVREQRLRDGDPGAQDLRNTNRLLWRFDGADGVKTGTTSAAGPCLIASATRDEMKLIAVVLHAGARWQDTEHLLDWGFANYRVIEVARRGDVLLNQPVLGGREPAVPLLAAADLAAVVPRGAAVRPRIEVQVPPFARAPLAAGQPVGTAFVLYEGEVRSRAPLLAVRDVQASTPLGRLVRWVLPWVYRYVEWIN